MLEQKKKQQLLNRNAIECVVYKLTAKKTWERAEIMN